jgi:hypothetical protein
MLQYVGATLSLAVGMERLLSVSGNSVVGILGPERDLREVRHFSVKVKENVVK